MESERRPALPSGHATMSALPQHMVNLDSSTATDSIDSNDSYRSQVPQQFYHSSHSSQSVESMETPRAAYSTVSTMKGNERPSAAMTYAAPSYGTAGEMGKMGHAFDGQLPIGMGVQFPENGGIQGQNYASQPYGTGYEHGHNVAPYYGGMTSPPPQYIQQVTPTRAACVPDPYAHFNVPNAMGNNYNYQATTSSLAQQHSRRGSISTNYGGRQTYQPPSQDSSESRRNSQDSLNTEGPSSRPSTSFSSYNTPYNVSMEQFNIENKHRGARLSTVRASNVLQPKDENALTAAALAEAIGRANEKDGSGSDVENQIGASQATSEAGQNNHKMAESADSNTPRPLRPHRSESVSAAEQAKNTSSWVEKTRSVGAQGELAARLCSPPPTRQNSLIVASPEGRDPYATPTRQPIRTNQLVLSASRPLPLSIYNDDGHSPQYKILTNGGITRPTLEEALAPENLPFEEYCRKGQPDTHGVVRIRNIPYNVSRQEIMAFLGRNARLVNENEHEPVHIVMERVTSKTLDCFVEFVNLNEAVNAVQRFDANKVGGRGSRLGQRHVDVELSSQDDLMKELFPKAKNVKWINGRPEIIPTDPNDKYNSGFSGFISKEELVMLVKHVEAPQRSPFSKDCPQRPFECLISTLVKYPWYAVDAITLNDRIRIHEATVSMCRLLYKRLNPEEGERDNRNDRKESMHINNMLLRRLWRTALNCKGYGPLMKYDIVDYAEVEIKYAEELGLIPGSWEWCPLWVIGPKPGVPMDVLNLYIGWIREVTTQEKRQKSLAEQAALGGGAPAFDNTLFGDFSSSFEYPEGRSFHTLAQIAGIEWTAIETALRRALTPALTA